LTLTEFTECPTVATAASSFPTEVPTGSPTEASPTDAIVSTTVIDATVSSLIRKMTSKINLAIATRMTKNKMAKLTSKNKSKNKNKSDKIKKDKVKKEWR
jgi:hypothetical protein